MKRTPLAVYLQTRAVTAPWTITGCTKGNAAGVVVIPALAESERLLATLASLAANPPEMLHRFLVLVVVNHREDATILDKEDSHRTLALLADGPHDLAGLHLGWVDAASAGKEMPVKGGGVGLARKIGLDLALTRLDWDDPGAAPLLVCLDADTLVEPSYLPSIVRHFARSDAGGAAIPFRHQPGRSPGEQHAIERYELFLRHYLLGLKIAGSPYAFHTVGSAMACTAAAYVKAGGMNTRTAGEDFYFLQHLYRTVGVARVHGTTVYPSPRRSHRVPFGTGRSVSRWLDGDAEAITFYRPECFALLGDWLTLVAQGTALTSAELIQAAQAASPHLAEYLGLVRFTETWDGLRRNNPDPDRFTAAFHGWFDGLKTMKLIHHLSARGLPRCQPEEALPPLLRQAGVVPAAGTAAQLSLLRHMEQEEEPPGCPLLPCPVRMHSP